MRETERKRLVKLIEEAHKKSAEAIHEHIMATLKEKGRFNSKTDADRQSIYEIEADYLLENDIIVPPVKVGRTVYVIDGDLFWKAKILGYNIHLYNELKIDIFYVFKGEEKINMMYARDFGKKIFLTKAEAEYALKNRRSVSLVNGHIEE